MNTMNMDRIVTMTNWTSEDFSHSWGEQVFDIPAYSTINIAEGIADTFAYHLAVRELNKEGKDVGCFINEYKAKAFGSTNSQVEAEEELTEDSGDSEKVSEDKTKEEVSDEEFEGMESEEEEIVAEKKKRGRKAKSE